MSVTLADPPPPIAPAIPGTVPILTREDYTAQHDLYKLLISEIRHLGRHGATPYRRSAASRVEIQLTLLQQQLTPHLG